MRGPLNKVCAECRRTFECGQYGCWCGTVGITESQMDWIEARYQDCLCSVCLKKVAAGEVGPQVMPHRD